MIITAVRPVRGHQVKLMLDDGGEVMIDKTIWEESPYGVDSSLSDAALEELRAASARRKAESKAGIGFGMSVFPLIKTLCRYAECRITLFVVDSIGNPSQVFAS